MTAVIAYGNRLLALVFEFEIQADHDHIVENAECEKSEGNLCNGDNIVFADFDAVACRWSGLFAHIRNQKN